ncbi:hypothetical protein ACJRO7_016745 [Eucalyptus globulus]|uniref:Leucine-rich repeat-containing N-terminal plant-type domain-containing protein n=1 Tax=Eucalyptus globulus TaxID=34317 RepID=A0ABD3LBJ8_EUCGL
MASLLYALLTWIVLLMMIHASLAKPLCHPDESSALMEFKSSFQINRTYFHCVPKVESWSLHRLGDCCSWDGVQCDTNGHVTGLDLSNSCLFGTITANSSLFHLLRLESLNLAFNDFNNSSIPYGFGNLSRLQNLNLSYSKTSGNVPSDISLLSRLISLDLSRGWNLVIPNVNNFVQNFTMLRELDLSYISISSPFPHVLANFSSLKSVKLVNSRLHGEFPVSIFQLPNLEVLDISVNYNLSGSIPEQQWGSPLKSLSLWRTNFSGEIPISIGNLVFLSLSECHFSGSLPSSLGNLSQLAHMDISNNKFHGHIPASFANLTELSFLDLGDIQLSGPFPSSFENLTRLVWLRLSYNNLQGEIPNSLWELKNLEFLGLSGNNLSGTVDLHKLNNLEVLQLDFNNISFVNKTEISTTPPNLSHLYLDSCNLHEFPKFLGYLRKLDSVSLSHNNIGGSIPMWMWNGSRETLSHIDLSHNTLTGFENGHNDLPLPKLLHLDISSNILKTELPSPPPLTNYYNISNNILFGGIQSICGARSLIVLDLSNNSLNGTIPSCLGNIDSLSILNLGKNKLEGTIPLAYPKGCVLKMIDLTENRLQGLVPRSLVNCSMLEYLNLGYNQILDGFPLWLSKLTELKAIILKSNKFHGPIETYRSHFNFSNLHIMDLSSNSFNGELPSKLFQSFHAMKVVVHQDKLEYMNTHEELPLSSNTSFLVVWEKVLDFGMKLMSKGIEREYSKVPYALKEIDLSNNKFKGCIPDIIGDLKSLVWLNLSNNILTGSIPPSLANLTLLESLDLSQNNLSGEIPQQLVQLNFLSSFDVSHNQLSGAIPQGSQFNTFKIDSFAMNEGLCGSPLPKNCTIVGDNLPLPPSLEEENDKESPFNLDWKVVLIGTGLGFPIGFVLGNSIIDEKNMWFLHYSKIIAGRWNRLGRH